MDPLTVVFPLSLVGTSGEAVMTTGQGKDEAAKVKHEETVQTEVEFQGRQPWRIHWESSVE
jgi:hypothetical protein